MLGELGSLKSKGAQGTLRKAHRKVPTRYGGFFQLGACYYFPASLVAQHVVKHAVAQNPSPQICAKRADCRLLGPIWQPLGVVPRTSVDDAAPAKRTPP